MSESSAGLFNRAEDGTAYWTLSIYVKSELLDKLRPKEAADDIGSAMRRAQLGHLPSMALRNAIDPLFNDIADRDFFGKPRDFLFAAGMGQQYPDTGAEWVSPKVARDALLDEHKIVMTMPNPIEWTTEGIFFKCHLAGNGDRALDLRRFWFVHSDGALSYHLSFAHHYGADGSNRFDVETLYFLSMLQKLAAPKEFALSDDLLRRVAGQDDQSDEKGGISVFATDADGKPLDLGIAPLDGMVIKDAGGGEPKRFWPYVRDLFVSDAALLFDEVLGWKGDQDNCPVQRGKALTDLLEPVDVLEVPGLRMPRCRYLFHIHDKAKFDRLLPYDPDSGEAIALKKMIRDQCYQPYRMAMAKLMRPGPNGQPADIVHLGDPAKDGVAHFGWSQLDKSGDYAWAISNGFFTDSHDTVIDSLSAFEKSVVVGGVKQRKVVAGVGADGQPVAEACEPFILDIPAYQPGRSDCLDYMFLSGFNQNIIDWLNQDTSEILDSLDPIYPTEALQAGERFFVRYANHRGMLTYVAASRSLEIGNDYIGTCPYAFLIHVIAMHNEFLARDHEARTATAIGSIAEQIYELEKDCGERSLTDECEELTTGSILARSRNIEQSINQLKRASYTKYQRHRYLNIFRYDTEADVFDRMSELRGTEWRGEAMDKALETLEEYAADIDRRQADADRRQADKDRKQADIDREKRDEDRNRSERHWRENQQQREEDRHRAETQWRDEQQRREIEKAAEEKRSKSLNLLLGSVGVVSGVGLLFNMADFAATHSPGLPSEGGEGVLAYVLGNTAMTLAFLGLCTLPVLLARYFIENRRAKSAQNANDAKSELERAAKAGSPPTISP
jgi:hypothetical protein